MPASGADPGAGPGCRVPVTSEPFLFASRKTALTFTTPLPVAVSAADEVVSEEEEEEENEEEEEKEEEDEEEGMEEDEKVEQEESPKEQ